MPRNKLTPPAITNQTLQSHQDPLKQVISLNQKDFLTKRKSKVCMIGAGDGNRTHDISLEG
jgi:hypothetical protein